MWGESLSKREKNSNQLDSTQSKASELTVGHHQFTIDHHEFTVSH